MPEIRVYMLLEAQVAVVPTDAQWNAVFSRMVNSQPMSAVIWNYAERAENYVTYQKRSLGTGYVNKIRLIGFEIDAAHRDEAVALLDVQAANRGITGTVQQKLNGVIQAEFQAAAQLEGFSANTAAKLVVIGSYVGLRDVTIAAAQQYLANNAAIWYAV